MTGYTFTVQGDPVVKQRPRVTRRGTYTPQATTDGEAAVVAAFRTVYPYAQPRPVWWALDITVACETARRSDIDNLAKLVMDALNGVLYPDDYAVVRLNVERRRVPKGQGYTQVRAYPVGAEESATLGFPPLPKEGTKT